MSYSFATAQGVIVPEPGLHEAKQALRSRIRAARALRPHAERELDATNLAAVVLEIPQVRMARRIAAYASLPQEPGTSLLLEALRAGGAAVILPLVMPDGVLEWAEYDGALRETHRLGGPEPTGARLGRRALADADVILVPALAVDTLGRRLGQGGGYYDRALPLADQHTPVIALLFDGEIFDAAVEPIPHQHHDCVVDAIATPRRYLPLHPGVGLSAWMALPAGIPRG